MKKPKCRTSYIIYYLLVFKTGSGARVGKEENKNKLLNNKRKNRKKVVFLFNLKYESQVSFS